MPTYHDVLDAARNLTPTEKTRLVEALWEDAPPTEWPLPTEEWIREVQRRSADHDAGRLSSAPWNEVQARARKQAGLDG